MSTVVGRAGRTGGDTVDTVDLPPRPPASRPPPRRSPFWPLGAVDVAVALLLALALVSQSLSRGSIAHQHGMRTVYSLVLAGALVLAVAGRRWQPLAAQALASTAAMTATFLDLRLGRSPYTLIAVAVVLYLVASAETARRAVATLVAVELGLVATALAALLWPVYPHAGRFALDGTWAVSMTVAQFGAWMAGRAARAARAYHEGLHEQAERRAQAELERAQRALTEQRLQIARELHDVVSHALSVIAVQAGVGSYVIATRPGEAAKSLAAIETTSRTALTEMRHLLGVLRDDRPGDRPGDLLPAPGLDALPAVLDQTARAGLHVELSVHGPPRPLPAGVDLTAYRVVQEALTNIVKHAGTDQRPVRGRVSIDYTDTALAIAVTDDGVGAAARAGGGHGRGHGLVGMRERVALYGGELHAAPLPGRGFRVTATLPLDDARDDAS